MKVSRRWVLAAVPGVAAVGAIGILLGDGAGYIHELIFMNTGLHADRYPAIREFSADLLEAFKTREKMRGWLAVYMRLKPRFLPILLEQEEQLDNHIISELIRSTNFILFSEKTASDLQYFGLPDPYARPCVNPLSSHFAA